MDRSDGGTTGEPFERALARFLLAAYASGDDVEGEWHLMDTDPMVPDALVTVTRVDGGRSGPASREGATFTTGGPTDFKSRLQTFVLERFADGDEIDGTWTVRYVRGHLPEWEVDIVTSAGDEVIRRGDEVSHPE